MYTYTQVETTWLMYCSVYGTCTCIHSYLCLGKYVLTTVLPMSIVLAPSLTTIASRGM